MKFKFNRRLSKSTGVNVFSGRYNGFHVSYWLNRNNSWGVAVGKLFFDFKETKEKAIKSAVEFIDRHIM